MPSSLVINISGFFIKDFGLRIADCGCGMCDVGGAMWDFGCGRCDVGGWMWEVGCGRLDVGGWISDFIKRCLSLLTISHQLFLH